jgi:hypothetical protein
MSIVTTTFGQQIDSSDALHILNGHIISKSAFFSGAESKEKQKVTASPIYQYNSEHSFWEQTNYALKEDAVRIHRSDLDGYVYIAKTSIPFAEVIEYDSKQLYFFSAKDRFNAGYVWSMDLFRWIDLKVKDKNLWGNLALVRTNEEDFKFVAKQNGSYFAPNRYAYSGDSIRMSQVRSHSMPIFYAFGHRDVVVEAITNEHTYIGRATEFYTMYGSERVKFYIKNIALLGLHQDEIVTININVNGLEVRCDVAFNPIVWDGFTYFDKASAVHNGYAQVFCPHCRRDVETSHDMEVCARRNFRNDRFGYHSGQSVKTIQIPSKVVFKIGVEIEKQTRLGAVHSHNDIMNEFGWRKERDGSLDGTIGYELVSPCYPLFTDELINEVKAMEVRFPNLIDSNEDKANLDYDKRKACGGHIHYSRTYTSGKDTFEMISGYMPLFYAIYKSRINISYCEAREKYRMKGSDSKYQAVKIMDDRIEFRIFPLVENTKTLEWRIGLLRIMSDNPTNSFNEVANMLTDSTSDLHKHMLKIFPLAKLKRRIVEATEMAKQFDRDYANFNFDSIITQVQSL